MSFLTYSEIAARRRVLNRRTLGALAVYLLCVLGAALLAMRYPPVLVGGLVLLVLPVVLYGPLVRRWARQLDLACRRCSQVLIGKNSVLQVHRGCCAECGERIISPAISADAVPGLMSPEEFNPRAKARERTLLWAVAVIVMFGGLIVYVLAGPELQYPERVARVVENTFGRGSMMTSPSVVLLIAGGLALSTSLLWAEAAITKRHGLTCPHCGRRTAGGQAEEITKACRENGSCANCGGHLFPSSCESDPAGGNPPLQSDSSPSAA